VSDVAKSLVAGRAVDCSEGYQERDFVHVDDVAGAFRQSLLSDWFGPFNIGTGNAVPVRQIVETLARGAGRLDLIQFGARPSAVNEPPLIYADTRVLREAIGFAPRIGLSEGLSDALDWWRDQGNM